MISKLSFKYCALSILLITFVTPNVSAGEYPETLPDDPRKVRSSSSPGWLQAVGRSIMVKSKTTKEGCSWTLVVDERVKDGVIVVGAYELFNINRNKLEKLLHHVFQDAQLQLKIPDRFGNPVHPKEWFFVTPDAVAKAVELIRSGEIKEWVYDAKSAGFERV